MGECRELAPSPAYIINNCHSIKGITKYHVTSRFLLRTDHKMCLEQVTIKMIRDLGSYIATNFD